MSQTPITPSIQCPAPILPPGAQGIGRVAVNDADSQLVVTFLTPIPPQQSYLFDRSSYSLTGGKRLFPRIIGAFPGPPASPPAPDVQSVILILDSPGDFSIYTLTVTGPEIDPFFSSARLRFRLACEDAFDCRQPATSPKQLPDLPVTIDYLAKDYAGFRQALIDFIPTRLPSWTERSEADIGMMLLELFSATADNLSYTQDRIANEAFLATATQRRSVALHLALIGYQMDEGASAYTWLQFDVSEAEIVPAGFKVSNDPGNGNDRVIVFETMVDAAFDPDLNEMSLYDWGNRDCCLPKDATSAALVGSLSADTLKAGDYLLFEGSSGQRDVVRLVVSPQILPVPDGTSPPAGSIVLVAWSDATPLRYDYCVAGARVRGNMVLSTHGETVYAEELRSSQTQPGNVGIAPGTQQTRRLRFKLQRSPLAHLDPAVYAMFPSLPQSASQPADPVAEFTLRAPRSISSLQIGVENDPAPWQQRTSLIGSSSEERVFRVEIDDDGEATVVFGDGIMGRIPPETSAITATYRAGGGAVGNVGADSLTKPYTVGKADWLRRVTNPLQARGGRDIESSDHARRSGPASIHQSLVAVSAADYQNAAASFLDSSGRPTVQRASANFRWTGSWLTVTLTLDPTGSGLGAPDLNRRLIDYLETTRLAGYDLEIASPHDVPVDLEIQFVATAGSNESDVRSALLQALSSGELPDGSKGFFHPDNFTFGQNLYISKIYQAAMAVPGVRFAQISRLARSHSVRSDQETALNLARGFLAVGADQVIRLDNDSNFPQNGTLAVLPQGVLT